MPSRPPRNSRYDDPYTFDEPYTRTSPPPNAYEYVGTDEPPSYPISPVNEHPRRSSPPRRQARTTSPPRRSRHNRTHESPPPAYERGASPPRKGRHVSPPPKADKHTSQSKNHKYRGKYQDFTQRPGVQRVGTYGRKGLGFIGDAAEAYLTGEAPQRSQRGRSLGPEPRGLGPDPRAARYPEDDYDREPRRSRHGRRPAYSPSLSSASSVSPPPRRRSSRYDDRRRPAMNGRLKSYSVSPAPLARDPDRERRSRRPERDRHSRRAYSYSPSPPPRSHDRRSRPKSTSKGFRSSMAENVKMSDKANATRWQMAARAALEAGGATALRLRKSPGSWTGDKGAKVATAALGAAAIDAFIDKDPRRSKEGGMKGMATTAVTGMLASKLMGFKGHTTRKGKPRYGY